MIIITHFAIGPFRATFSLREKKRQEAPTSSSASGDMARPGRPRHRSNLSVAMKMLGNDGFMWINMV